MAKRHQQDQTETVLLKTMNDTSVLKDSEGNLAAVMCPQHRNTGTRSEYPGNKGDFVHCRISSPGADPDAAFAELEGKELRAKFGEDRPSEKPEGDEFGEFKGP